MDGSEVGSSSHNNQCWDS